VICPKCKANRAHRSHRRGLWEHLAVFFAHYPYRCHACKHRFLRFRYAVADGGEPSSTEAEIRATRSAAKWKQKKQELLLYGLGLLIFLVFLYFITRPSANPVSGG
jgi:transposase-like protein